MRNIKELKPILTAIHCINYLGNNDKQIEKLIKYAFNRIMDSNTNLITLACVGRNKEDVVEELKIILKEETKFNVEEL